MTETEYREFLGFLFERYVRPQLARVRSRHHHHVMDGDDFAYQLDRAVSSARIFRFIESHSGDDDDPYNTFTKERLSRAVAETSYSLHFSNRLIQEAGFLDACEFHAREIADGITSVRLPDVDIEVLREIGSLNPELEMRGLAYRAKAFLEQGAQSPGSRGLRQQLQRAEEELKGADEDTAKKPRRWFKGVGQIAQGAALSIADVALVVGTLHLPVSPETKTWGALASVATGIGAICSGIGDLRNE
jgi:hypothetical protein